MNLLLLSMKFWRQMNQPVPRLVLVRLSLSFLSGKQRWEEAVNLPTTQASPRRSSWTLSEDALG